MAGQSLSAEPQPMRRPWAPALRTPHRGGSVWPLAGWASCPEAGAAVLGVPGDSSALRLLRTDR